jgi:aubergine-like protein
MACDVLGPRGDEKNGCRDAWIAFCSFTGIPSTISSFKSNRFNNLFEAAAALHFHREDIILFLRDYMPHKNGKLKSVLFDACCDHVAAYTLTLALLFFRLTGPYWQLLGSDLHYLDFHEHVVNMRDQLNDWSKNAQGIFSPEHPTLFGQPSPDSASFTAAVTVKDELKEQVVEIFQPLCKELSTVVDLQLADFLPGGVYHAVTDLKMRQKLSHSKLTNIIGEACFGDLDLSIYKRRNATCHHHATMTMLVRNKTVSSWFDKKTGEQQKHLLKLSATKGQELRKRHVRAEQEVVTARKCLLEQKKDEHDQQTAALARKKDDIITALQAHRGPCKTPQQVDDLLRRFSLQKERRALLHLEMSYHKLVLGRKSPMLRTSLPSIEVLAANLKSFLRDHAGKKQTITFKWVPNHYCL